MYRLLFALLLFVPSMAYGQEVSPVRKKPSSDVVKSAEEIVRASKAAPIVMPYGGYALVPMELAAEAYIVPGSNDCIDMELIPKGKSYKGWLVSKDKPGVFEYKTIPPDDKFDRIRVSGIDHGAATIIWHAVVDGKSVIVDGKVFQVGDKPDPKPPGPTPPGPGPEPLPPIPGAGFRVLIVTETKDLSTLPSAQVQSLTAKEVRDYLDSHTVKEGNQPEYRIFDKDIDLSKASQVWKDAMARPRQSLPWIVVTNGKTGYEGPLPKDKASLMTLLKQYGGQ